MTGRKDFSGMNSIVLAASLSLEENFITVSHYNAYGLKMCIRQKVFKNFTILTFTKL